MNPLVPRLLLLIIFPVNTFIAVAQENEWLTYYEKSDFKKTPGYNETINYAKRLAESNSFISYESFGTSPQGRKLPLLIIDKSEN